MPSNLILDILGGVLGLLGLTKLWSLDASDALSVTDELQLTIQHNRYGSDDGSTVDTIDSKADFTRLMNEIMSFHENLAWNVNCVRTSTDSVILVDVPCVSNEVLHRLEDWLDFADFARCTTESQRILTYTVTVPDEALVENWYHRSSLDEVLTSDSVQRWETSSRSVIDDISIEAWVGLDCDRERSDTLTIIDSLALTNEVCLHDALTIVETFGRVLELTLSNLAAITDGTQTAANVHINQADSLSLAERLQLDIDLNLTAVLAISDTVQVGRFLGRTRGDEAYLSEAFEKGPELCRADNVGIVGVLTLALSYSFADSMDVSDHLTIGRERHIEIVDLLETVIGFSTELGVSRTDSVSIAEYLRRVWNYEDILHVTLGEELTLACVLHAGVERTRKTDEMLSLQEMTEIELEVGSTSNLMGTADFGYQVVVGPAVFTSVIRGFPTPIGPRFTRDSIRAMEIRVASTLAYMGITSGSTLEFMRKSTGLTVDGLAQLLGIMPKEIEDWESERILVPRSYYMTLVGLVCELDHRIPPNDIQLNSFLGKLQLSVVPRIGGPRYSQRIEVSERRQSLNLFIR